MAAARKPATPGTRTLVIEHSDGRRRKLTVPANAKVTYGLLHPGGKTGWGDCFLRVYEGTKQTVCIGGVKSFIDASYPLEVERIESEAEETVVDGKVRTQMKNVNYGFEAVEF